MSNTNIPSDLIASFAGRKVAVIGDIVADQYLQGSIARISREAPVFILRHDRTETFPGAAANAAANLASLGGSPALVGTLGKDRDGDELLEKLAALGVDIANVVAAGEVRTTTKVRVLAGHPNSIRQQVIRIDYESSSPLGPEILDQIVRGVERACSDADAIIFSDYGYWSDAETIFAAALDAAGKRGVPLLVDSRFALSKYRGATAATPNREEAEAILGTNFDDREADALRKQLGLRSLLITNGSKGMSLYSEGAVPEHIAVVGSDVPVDVTGAGDTVIAAFALALAGGCDASTAANIANHAGGLVVMKRGTAVISADELKASLDEARN